MKSEFKRFEAIRLKPPFCIWNQLTAKLTAKHSEVVSPVSRTGGKLRLNMRRFRFLFHIPTTSLTIGEPYSEVGGRGEFTFPTSNGPIEVVLSDFKVLVGNLPVNHGLLALVEISGNSLSEVEPIAWQRLEGVLCLAAVQANTTIGDAHLKRGYEITAESATTDFMQVDESLHDIAQRKRKADADELVKLTDAFTSKYSDRVSRAVRWYRKGLHEEDAIDQAMSFWTGLEAVNPLLKTKFGAEDDTTKCKACGKRIKESGSLGIRELFIQYSVNGVKDFNTCRKLRNAISHSYDSMASVYPRCVEATVLMQTMLRTAIFYLLDLPVPKGFGGPEPIYEDHQVQVTYLAQWEISPDQLPDDPVLDTSNSRISAEYNNGALQLKFLGSITSNVDAPSRYTLAVTHPSGIDVTVEDEEPGSEPALDKEITPSSGA